MRRLLAVLVALVLVLSFGAGSASAAKQRPVTVGSGSSDPAPHAGFQAMMDYCSAATGEPVIIDTFNHTEFQDNILAYLQGTPDPVFSWFAGERMRFLASQGLLSSINDVWARTGANYTAALRAASSANGQPYLVPMYDYPWVVLYRPSVFAAHGYTVPTTLAQFTALAAQMQLDGLVPLAYGDAEGWPAMGTFDILDMRMNGYTFHMDLMAGRAKWTDARVRAVFQQWAQLLPFTQGDTLGRTWQAAAQGLSDGTAGMYFFGTFAIDAVSNPGDLAMFPFPLFGNQWDVEKAIDAPIDGLALSANGSNLGNGKTLLGCVATGPAQLAFLADNGGYVAAAQNVDTSGYSPYRHQMADIIKASNAVAQFLDRDARPDFTGPAGMQAFLASFLANPGQDLSPYLAGIQSFYDSLP
jgi:multiple sugar transport system substrate-binding protein